MLLGIMTMLSLISGALIAAGAGGFADLSWLWILPLGALGSFLVLAALAFLFLWAASAVVDLDKPQEKDSKFYRTLLRLCLEAVFTVLRPIFRVHTRGLEQTPRNERFMLVCNHLDNLDPVTLIHFFRHSQLAFISKRENYSMFLVGKLMHKLLCQPINRENDREALKTILKCVQILKEDKASIAAFPEGYCSEDFLLHPFRHGVFKIALKTQVPIVVCTLQNTQYGFHNLARLKRTDVHLHLVRVIRPEEYEGMTTVQLGEWIHSLMAEDLGPDLVLPAKTAENT